MTNKFEHAYALIIGTGEPSATRNDARALRDVLVDPFRCAYYENHVRTLTDEFAVTEQILTDLDWLGTVSRTNLHTSIIVFFSGHGLSTKDGRFGLVPNGLRSNDQDWERKVLWADALNEALRKIDAKKLLVIFDCCYAGGMADIKEGTDMESSPKHEPSIPESVVETLAQGEGRVIVCSSKSDERSWTRRGGELSRFTHYLLEALKGRGPVERGTINLDTTLKWVGDQVREESNGSQTVWVKYEGPYSGLSYPIAVAPDIAGKDHPTIDDVYDALERIPAEILNEFLNRHYPHIARSLSPAMSNDQKQGILIDYIERQPEGRDALLQRIHDFMATKFSD